MQIISNRVFAIAGLLASSLLASAAFAGTGAQDSTFGSGGVVSIGLTNFSQVWSDVKIQPDGKIVAAGYKGPFSNVNVNFLVARYLTDGSLDRSFNGTGIVEVDFGGNRSDLATSLALQSDGKIVVAGNGYVGFTANRNFGPSDLVIVRLNRDGSPDATFGNAGLVITDLAGGRSETAENVLLLPSGRLIVSGTIFTTNSGSLSLVAYNANGTLDTLFGTGGRVEIPFGANFLASFYDATLQDGKLLVVGTSGSNFLAARFDPNTGVVDPTFGTAGFSTVAFPNLVSRVTSLVTQADGKLLLVGDGFNPDGDNTIVAARLNPNGQRDTTFTNFPNGRFQAFSPSPSATSLVSAVLSNGRLVVNSGAGLLLRLNLPDGSLDQTFGNDTGRFGTLGYLSINPVFSPATAVQPDGRVIVGGSAFSRVRNDATLVRYDLDSTIVLQAPAAPSALAAPTIAPFSVTLTWRDNSTNEASFLIERSNSTDFSDAFRLGQVSPNVTTFTDNTAIPGNTYVYRITAINSGGSSSSPTLTLRVRRR